MSEPAVNTQDADAPQDPEPDAQSVPATPIVPATPTAEVGMGWWWFGAWLIFLLSLLPPIVYQWRHIEDTLDRLRYPFGPHLMPAELLMLRHLATLSHWVPVLLLCCMLAAFVNGRDTTGSKPDHRRQNLGCGIVGAAVFSLVFLSYCLLILAMYLRGFAEQLAAQP